MQTVGLNLELMSDATFGRGDGIAGLIDAEIEYDTQGLPFLRGRTLKGLLVEECANLLFALEHQQPQLRGETLTRLQNAARFLFGQPGSTLTDDARMRIGRAQLPTELKRAVREEIEAENLTAAAVLESLTAIRRQTAVDEETGAPDEGSLRSLRVLLRGTTLTAELQLDDLQAGEPAELLADAQALLAACVKALRRAGTGRNRGRGRLIASLTDTAFAQQSIAHFRETFTEARA